jgi:hypothetical protein
VPPRDLTQALSDRCHYKFVLLGPKEREPQDAAGEPRSQLHVQELVRRVCSHNDSEFWFEQMTKFSTKGVLREQRDSLKWS